MRLDSYLADKGLAKSRTFAKELIDKKYVTVDGKTITKASFDVTEEMTVCVTGTPYEYVGRGGLKLEAALDSFEINPNGFVCVDIGASSGGFTDCLLKRGADKVFAVDSGSGQLDEKLRSDSRVVNIENFNARVLSPETLGTLCDIAVMDVSFISQTLILDSVKGVLKPDGVYVGLVKPQFECGKEGLSKGGIVKDKKIMRKAIEKVCDYAESIGLGITGLIKSPVTGGDGNTEFLISANPDKKRTVTKDIINEVCGL